MNKIFKLLFSPSLAVFLLFVFAFSMASATFIENDYGTQTARAMIYNAWWFEIIMLLLAISFTGNIFKYKLYRKEKIPVFTFHIAFIIILIGAGITRFTAYEGIMRIREGEKTNTIISDRNFLQITVSSINEKKLNLQKERYFSPLKNNNFSIETSYKNTPINIKYVDFIPDAQPTFLKESTNGKPIIEIVISSGNGKETKYLKKGTTLNTKNGAISFNDNQKNAINIIEEDGVLKIKPTKPLSAFVMETQVASNLTVDSIQTLNYRTLYRSGNIAFVLMNYYPSASFELQSVSKKPKDNDDTIDDLLKLELNIGKETEIVNLTYKHGFIPKPIKIIKKDIHVTLTYGAIPINIPFEIKLNDFQLERYPGSTSPSSYASEITILNNDKEIPFRIFMNNVLDYKGYRFFQASYDTDERGTVLAVNHDRAGTIITYIGYFLMGLGMLLTLSSKKSRFSTIQKKLSKLKNKSIILLLLCSVTATLNLNATNTTEIDSLLNSQVIDSYHASLFGRLMVQDLDGRIKPINTLASEFLRKVSRKPHYEYKNIRLDANQTFLAMQANPILWVKIPLIKIAPKKGGTVYKEISPTKNDLIAFNDLIDGDQNYILQKHVEEANAKKPSERNEFDKEVLKVDERFNILFNMFSGNYLKIFPKRNDPNKTWYSYSYGFSDFPKEDIDFVKEIIPLYFIDIENAKKSGDYTSAENKLAYIKKYQEILAGDIIPSTSKIEAELWYNRLNLNFWLFQFYWVIGFLLLTIAIISIFKNSKVINISFYILALCTFIIYLSQTGYLILRWYVSDHAPWSNGYEMITFVAWSVMLFGLLFYKKSSFSLPLATLFTGTLIFVSYLDWLSPEITNLMPVLKSYWLKIHVATIISSYAPLALSALLGLMALILTIIKTPKNKTIINIKIKELTYINELSMTIGLFLLSIGTFLGGIWANESWGRYWAWDPKETWALISMIIYAAVLHFHFIPGLKSKYTFNVASVFAFYTIIMTSFGVNYYLTGLHSYATGDPVPIPSFIYIISIIFVTVSFIAYWRNKKML